ncbi:hypothetical protein [Cerasicoccus maritimus]|uniref:hypothetical protein n=1 Tax=Cerasicoccus maritimus TaxID=490089 RepID=UPI0028526093|nr:hypothetical protein [Cerasicoccus maritimus]
MGNRTPYISAFITLGILGSFQVFSNDILSIAVFALAFISFYKGLDTHIPIIEITACIASLQWLIGPIIAYAYGSTDIRYEMYIEADQYYVFALPGTCFYLAALYLFPAEVQQKEFLKGLGQPILFYRGVALFILGILADIALRFGPGSLAFAFVLLSQLRYVAAIYFLFSGHRWRYPFAVLAMTSLVVRSAESAMFHDLIIWVSLVACYWFHTVKWTPPKKAVFFSLGFICVFVIQIIKADYREKVWGRQEVSLLATVYEKIVLQQGFFNKHALMAAGQRINQGWIVSAIMVNVPLAEPYAGGETIKDAVISSIFPRAVMKNKKQAGGQENFERFTGLNLENGTSMGTSILGEAYANFGRFKGVVFMFIWGLCYAGIYKLAIRFTYKDAYFLFWIPLIFYQAIKAETELVVVLNQLVKGSILALGGFICIHKFIIPSDEEADDEELTNQEEENPQLPESN